MYEYITNCKKGDLVIAYAYMYWIEYIAHVETVFIEVPEIMNKFCNKDFFRISTFYQFNNIIYNMLFIFSSI